jgi:hypothetical protein
VGFCFMSLHVEDLAKVNDVEVIAQGLRAAVSTTRDYALLPNQIADRLRGAGLNEVDVADDASYSFRKGQVRVDVYEKSHLSDSSSFGAMIVRGPGYIGRFDFD